LRSSANEQSAPELLKDIEEAGERVVSNGLALCSIHHRAYDHDLVSVTRDYDVRVSPRLLEDEDGPMLDLLKTFDRQPIYAPRRTEWKPDRERLASRFDRFLTRSAA
jgi:putative restriction endonuclease